MSNFWVIVGWFFTIIFSLLLISMLLMKNWRNVLVLFLLVLLVYPPVNSFVKNQFAVSIHPVLRLVLIAGLVFIFGRLLLGAGATSIYK